MPTAICDGISTRYEVIGSGPPILMYAPAGFDASLEKWTTQGVYARIKLMEHLPKHYTCIVFDRRECGQSGGRVERVTWAHYVRQGLALLDHLKIQRAHIMGGCMGCCPAAAFGVLNPERVASIVLYWPVGGAKYRIASHQRFTTHIAFVQEHGLDAVVKLVNETGKAFGADPRGGPWAAPIRTDAAFAAAYAKQDVESYKLTVLAMMRALFDRDTSPCAEPEVLMQVQIPALIVPGHDASHATSAARYMEECLPKSEYWDAAVADQTESTAPKRVMAFLERIAI